MSDLLQRVEASIISRRLFRRGEAILVAVSGGLDSMVLLHLLARLAPEHDWQIMVAHFNHRLRRRSSDADEHLVARTAKKLGLPFFGSDGDVPRLARERKISVEMAARELRHAFFAAVAVKLKLGVIAVAHHADDQVELFFLRLLRGAGGEGLAGMKWRGLSPAGRDIFLARPFLNEPKSALLAWAKHEKIPFREDATNSQFEFRRNRIRHELLPLLRKHYQPALGRVILRQMDVIGAEAEFVNAAAQKWLRSGRSRFSALPVAVQRQCLQIQLVQNGLAANFDLVEQLRENTSRPVAVTPEILIVRDASGRVRLRQAAEPKFDREEMRLRLGGRAGEVKFANALISWQFITLAGGIVRAPKNGVNCECFDADKVGTVIGLRHWRPGDRFQPIGMRQSVKLQDLFVNLKVPRADRRRRLVAVTGAGELFWVEGLRLAECFKLDKNTRRGLKWCWKRV